MKTIEYMYYVVYYAIGHLSEICYNKKLVTKVINLKTSSLKVAETWNSEKNPEMGKFSTRNRLSVLDNRLSILN
jgi:hypothetical protein